MPNKFVKKIRIGWDIGGAHIKYCVYSDMTDVIWYDIIENEFWNKYNTFRQLIKKVNCLYKNKEVKIENYFTMSAEMCDCFDNRDTGVNYIIQEIINSKCQSYIFTRDGFMKPEKIYQKDFKNIASYNWYASAMYISRFHYNTIAVDFGSTTCDFLIIKNGKIKNKRVSDISGLDSRELLYTGCARTPLYAHLKEVICDNKKYNRSEERRVGKECRSRWSPYH